MPAKQTTRWMAPALPVFAGKPAPTGLCKPQFQRRTCGSGLAREADDAVAGTGFAGVRGQARSYRIVQNPAPAPYLWERVYPRSRRRGGWHRLCRCSRASPLPQDCAKPGPSAVPVGAGLPVKQTTRWMAPALPVFAGKPAPTGLCKPQLQRRTCGSGLAREADDAVDGTGFAGVRGQARSYRIVQTPAPAPYLWERACPRSRRRGGWHRLCRCSRASPLLQDCAKPGPSAVPVGAGLPAKQTTRWMAPALPVFAGKPAPTGLCKPQFQRRSYRIVQNPAPAPYLWERVYPRSRRRGGWHRLCRCSRASPLLQDCANPSSSAVPVGAGLPAKQTTRWMAPALPVFAGKPAPTGLCKPQLQRRTCGSGLAREADDAVAGTGFAGVRG